MYRSVCLVALLACGKGSSPEQKGPPPEVPLRGIHALRDAIVSGKLTGPGLSITAKPLATPTTPGPVYLVIKDVPGLVVLDQGKATRVRYEGITDISSLAVDGEQLYIVAGEQLYKVTGTQLEKVGGPVPEYIKLVIAPDHGFWGRSINKVYRLDKDTWTAVEIKGEMPSKIGFDGAGHVFVHSSAGLSVLDGGAWKAVVDYTTLSKDQRFEAPCLTATAVSPSGELWIASCGELMRVAKGKATFTTVEAGLLEGRFLGDKFYALAWDKEGLSRFAADGTRESYTKSEVGGVRSIDGRGRLWSSHPVKGLEVIQPDGKIIKYPFGAIAEINGDVTDIVIAGTGPDELPAAAAELARGTISGRVVVGGIAISDGSVELCGDPDQEFKKTPCTGKPDRVTGKTDKTGAFKIEAPLKSYRVVVESAGKWFTTPLWQKGCVDLKPGDDCHMGEMDTLKTMP